MSHAILSIAVPAYNVESYLKRGLESYCDERLDGVLEVIIVNDGSTDATRAIAERYVERTPGIFKLINKENGGHGSAVNAGIAAASGKYFRVIDGDDWADTENLVRLCEMLKAQETDLVVDVKCEVDMQSGEREMFCFPDYIPACGPQDFAAICTRDEIGSYIMIHTLMIKTDYLKRCGLHLLEHTFYVDFQYVVGATISARDICFLDINVYQYLVGNAAQSVADDNYVRRWDDHSRVTYAMLDLYESKKDSLESARREYLKHRCVLLCNTHYNIALIFDKDRRRGIERAKEFRSFLQTSHPDIATETDSRYRKAHLLHYLGVKSQEQLNRLHR